MGCAASHTFAKRRECVGHPLSGLGRFWFQSSAKFSGYGLFVFVAVGSATATMGRATTRGCGMGGATGRVVVRGCGMGTTHGATAVVSAIAPGAYGPWPTSAIGCIRASTAVSTAGDIPASASAIEAMIAPAVAIAPARPWTHAQEDAVIEIARPIKSAGCAAVRSIVVVAV